MKISVCIPTYNRPDLLKEAIDSCLAQTFLPSEILVGDDSKNRESEALVRSYITANPNITISYLKNVPSLGQLANVNLLIERASADKFVLLHDDDLLTPTALEVMSRCFETHANAEVVYGRQVLIREDGSENPDESEELNRRFYRTSEFEGTVLSSVEAAILQQFPNDGYMIDMAIVKKIKYGDKDIVGNAGDFDFGLRLGKAGYVFHFVSEVTAKYRVTKSSVARNGTDSGYQSFKLISNLEYAKSSDVDYQKEVLERKAPIAILQATDAGKIRDAISIYFGKWHRGKIFTPGGFRRFFKIIDASFRW